MITTETLNKALAFFGVKFNELKDAVNNQNKTIKLDLGEASTEFSKASKELGNLVKTLEGKEAKETKVDESSIESAKHLSNIAVTLKETQTILAKLSTKNNDFPSDLKSSLLSLSTFVQKWKPEEKKNIDLSDLTKMVIILRSVSEKLDKNKNGKLEDLMVQMLTKLNNLEFPKTLKLDDMQLRQLSSGRSGGVSMGGGPSTNGLVYDGRKTVAVTNTAVRLATDKLCEEVFITALTTNTDVVVIGGPGVVHTEATRTGRMMNPGDSIVLKIHNLKDVWVNGAADDGVAYTYTA